MRTSLVRNPFVSPAIIPVDAIASSHSIYATTPPSDAMASSRSIYATTPPHVKDDFPISRLRIADQ
ncbi:MAG: hypothetical protein V3Q69_11990 [Burkholderia sp.]